MANYHGPTPVTPEDKKMAKKHLDMTEDMSEDRQELLKDKIDDHRKALNKAIKNKNKQSASYNRTHLEDHEDELDDETSKKKQLVTSQQTLSKLPKTYNDVRSQKVALMSKKAGA